MPTLGELRQMYLNQASARAAMQHQNPQTAPLFGGDAHKVHAVTPQRALYNEVLEKYAGAPDELSILPGTLRSEVKTNATTQKLVWNLRSDQPNPTNAIRTTEQRLQTRDSFICDRITVMFGLETNASTTPSATVLQQWPNPALTAVGGLDAAAPAVQQAYNGVLTGIINTTQFMVNMDMLRFLYADFNQRGTLIFTASNTAYNTFAGDRGFADLTPTMDIKGSDTAQFTCQIPDPANFGGLAANSTVAALIMRGLYIQGGAQYKL